MPQNNVTSNDIVLVLVGIALVLVVILLTRVILSVLWRFLDTVGAPIDQAELAKEGIPLRTDLAIGYRVVDSEGEAAKD